MNFPVPGYEVSSDDKLWAALAYIFAPIVPIILLLMEDKKNRPFLKAHNAQALVLSLLIIALSAISFGICSILWFVQLFFAYKAYTGTLIELPGITNFLRQQGWA